MMEKIKLFFLRFVSLNILTFMIGVVTLDAYAISVGASTGTSTGASAGTTTSAPAVSNKISGSTFHRPEHTPNPVDMAALSKPAGLYSEYHTLYVNSASVQPQPTCPKGSMLAADTLKLTLLASSPPPPYIWSYQCIYSFSYADLKSNQNYTSESVSTNTTSRTIANPEGIEYASFNPKARNLTGKPMTVTFVASNNDNYNDNNGVNRNDYWIGNFTTAYSNITGYDKNLVSTTLTLSDDGGNTNTFSAKILIPKEADTSGMATPGGGGGGGGITFTLPAGATSDPLITATITSTYYPGQLVKVTKTIVANWLLIEKGLPMAGQPSYFSTSGVSTLTCSGTVTIDAAWAGKAISIDCCLTGFAVDKDFDQYKPNASYSKVNAIIKTSTQPFSSTFISPCP